MHTLQYFIGHLAHELWHAEEHGLWSLIAFL